MQLPNKLAHATNLNAFPVPYVRVSLCIVSLQTLKYSCGADQ